MSADYHTVSSDKRGSGFTPLLGAAKGKGNL
jgi:hypothetical protein